MSLKKIINIMLIGFLVFSNLSLSPAFAEEKEENELGNKEVTLYIPDLEENLIIYENKELTEELAHIENNSPALLLEDEDTNYSLVEIETESKEKLRGYVQTDAVVKEEPENLEEYKLYAETEGDTVQFYSDELLKDELYKLADGTSVLVNKIDLESALEREKEFIFVSLNPETETIPDGLVDEINEIEEIQGFVKIDHLISLEDEAAFLEKRNEEKEEIKEEQEETEENKEEQEKDESEESEKKEDPSSNKEEKIIENEEEKNSDDTKKEEGNSNEKEEDSNLTEKESKEESTFSIMKNNLTESSTSRLGHIRGGERLIYETPGGDSFKATSDHKNKVYYIKREATMGSEKYYLLSNAPSATRGVLGWMKAKDLSTHTHTGVTRKPVQLMIKGNGKATSKAWGGSKDTVHASMSSFKGDTFAVNLTEKVGNNTWYRGQINGRGANVWLHSSQTEKLEIKETSTSRLGHIRGGERYIYEVIGGKSFKATPNYTNAVYYIKREAKVGQKTYYLLSKSPSATRGVVGWMKAEDLSTHTHKSVTRKPIQFTIKGNGKATSKAWGGSKDTIHSSMTAFQGEFFDVNLTEKVGNNTWYRGKINNKGANVWLHSSQVLAEKVTETDYGLTLNKAVEIQVERGPFVMNGSHGFIAKSLVDQNNRVKVNSNVRTMPQTAANRDNKIITNLKAGTKINPIGEIGEWHAIEVGGSRKVTALANQIKSRLDPKNSIKHSVNRFQFLDLRKRTGLSVTEMNRELATRGILQGEGEAFRTASIRHGINEMYLIVHARLETGNGTSALSNGTYEVGLNNSGNPELVTASNRLTLTNIKKTYNMFGIGAIDTDPGRGGAITAYNEGWFTPSAAIIGGAAWIKDSYIYNVHNQNTLYKMRWNPNMVNGYAWKQYATDIDWALKQAVLMHGVYSQTDKNKALTFDLPTYR